MVRAVGLATCIVLGSGCTQETFFCDTPEDCASEGGGGACESTGYCSFPDPECDTGRRYGDLAPSGLAGTCVPQTADTDGSTGVGPTSISSTSDSSTSASDTTLSETTSTAETTVTPPDSSTSTGDAESSSTGAPPECCDASCSTCGDACESEVLGSTDSGEALAVAVVGTTLFWTTGYNREVFAVDLTTGDSTLLAVADNTITNIATDDEHLYFLSFGNSVVTRIDLTTGAQNVVANVSDANGGIDFEAGFGQIVLDDSDVYFALVDPLQKTNGGAFRAPKEADEDQPPERIGMLQRPIGIGIDEDSVYVTDLVEEALIRFDKAALDSSGTEMLELNAAGHIYVADTAVYATGDGQVTRVPKDGSPPQLLATTDGNIRGITGDEQHVYFTDYQAQSVTRISLFDTEAPVQIASSPGAWGIALDCSHVYWCENGTLSVLGQAK